MNYTLANIRSIHKCMDKNGNCQIENYFYNQQSDLLGEGSFGKLEQLDKTNQRQLIAIKVLDLSLSNTSTYKQILKNEIVLMMQLKGPNVVRILDTLCDYQDKELYLILEYCQQGDLRNQLRLSPNGRLPEQQAIQILKQVLTGYRELLEKGYIHRDIKPDNILIQGNIYKLGDFGLASKIPQSNYLKTQAGTPLYMAPQVLEGKEYSSKCDIWSFGLVFYEMLFGKTPWLCRSVDTYLAQIKSIQLKFPYEIPISQNIKDFIRNCLQIEEKNRFSWEQVFGHGIFQNQQQIQRKNTQERLAFNQNQKELLQILQDTISQIGIQVQDLLKYCQKDSINIHQFTNMMNKIAKNVSTDSIHELFKKFDTSGDGLISADEFAYVFNEYDFTPVEELPIQIIKELQAIIKHQNIKITDLFKYYDSDKNGVLDFNEFVTLVRRIAPKLGAKEIQIVFQNYDQDRDGFLSLKELQFVLSSPNYRRLKKVIETIKSTLKKRQVSVKELFINVDKQQKGYINFSDFKYLVNKIEILNERDIWDLFQLIDSNCNQQIDLYEFEKLFY